MKDNKDIGSFGSVDDFVHFIKEKIEELDRYTYLNKEKQANETRMLLHQIRNELSDKDKIKRLGFKNDPELFTYPDYEDADFTEKIYKKKEFNKFKYEAIDTSKDFKDLANKECSSKSFRLTPNQIFLKNFMSSRTPYRNILLFHGVGVGKCHQRDTGIICFDGKVKKVQDIRVGDELMGDDSTPRTVTSLATGKDKMYKVIYDTQQFTVNFEHILVLYYEDIINEVTMIQDMKKPETTYIHFYIICNTLKVRQYVSYSEAVQSQKQVERLVDCHNGRKVLEIRVDMFYMLPKFIKNKLYLFRVPILKFKQETQETQETPNKYDQQELNNVHVLGERIERELRWNGEEKQYDSDSDSDFRYILQKLRTQSLLYRQRFMYGFLKNSILNNVDHTHHYDEDIVFICRSVGIGIDVLEIKNAVECTEEDTYIHTSQNRYFQNGMTGTPIRMKINLLCNYVSDSSRHFTEKYCLLELFYGKYLPDLCRCIYHIDVEQLNSEQEYYGFTLDGNHRYILDDMIVTHNTCSAITIAEQYQNVFSKPALVLMPSSLQDNFKKQVFNIDKPDACTGSKYLKQVPNYQKKDKIELKRAVGKLINRNYEIMGHLSFAKGIERLEKRIRTRYPEDIVKQNKIFHQRIKALYSNRVIIIDEVHNVRTQQDNEILDKKKTPKQILKVLQIAENVMLVLLSATPMYDSTVEIIQLFRLLLANDKKPLIEKNQIFNEDKTLKPEGVKILSDISKKYVSYMRGDNPFSFPFTFYPDINNDPNVMKPDQIPTKNIYGVKIPEKQRLNHLVKKLTINKLSNYQQSVYDYFKPDLVNYESQDNIDDIIKYNKEDYDDDNDDDDDDEKFEKQMMYNMTKLRQCSILSYPVHSKDMKNAVGKLGLEYCFFTHTKNRQHNRRNIQFQYKSEARNFLAYENVGKYSSKIKSILDYILNSDGIVFIYSEFLNAALIPLCLALEHIGFSKSDGSQMLYKTAEVSTSFPDYRVKTEQGEFRPKYSLLTQDQAMNVDIPKEVEKITSRQNTHGEQVKVILGTNVVTEGYDFKNIRQIHILEPWYNLNKHSQIIGRAIRKCSHIALPVEKRNVTVYQHVGFHPQEHIKGMESIDLRFYTVAENKQSTIDQIEQIMMENSVDCALNQKRLTYPVDKLNMTLDKVTTSQKKVIKSYKVGDKMNLNPKITSMKCKYIPNNTDTIVIDDRTFHRSFFENDIDLYRTYIKEVYANPSLPIVFSFKNLLKYVRLKSGLDVDEDVFKFALDDMLKNEEEIMNANGEVGFLVFLSDKYMFQPKNAPYSYFSKRDRKDYKTNYIRNIVIDDKKMMDYKLERDGSDKHKLGQPRGSSDDVDVDAMKFKKRNKQNKKILPSIMRKVNDMKTKTLGHVHKNDKNDKISKKNIHLFLSCLSYIVDRLNENDLIKFVEEVLLQIHEETTQFIDPRFINVILKLTSDTLNIDYIDYIYTVTDTVSNVDDITDINIFLNLCLVVLLKGNYLVFMQKQKSNQKNIFDIYFRNSFYLYASYEISTSKINKVKNVETYEIERSIMSYDKQIHKLTKMKLLQLSNILNFPEVKLSFKFIDLDILKNLKGYVSIDFNENKQPSFKIIDKKIDGGVKCGTGGMSQSNLIDRVNDINSEFIDTSVRYKKTDVCILYELVIRMHFYSHKSPVLFLNPIQRYFLEEVFIKKI